MEEAFRAYLDSDAFRLFMDKTLRDHACHTVENLCRDYDNEDYITSSQLHSISTILQSEGVTGLEKTNCSSKRKKFKRKKTTKEERGYI